MYDPDSRHSHQYTNTKRSEKNDFMYEPISTNQKLTDIDVDDLITTHNTRKRTRLKVYNEIYSKCCNKIKYINDVLLERECKFTIPRFRWGLPLFQHKAALGFVMIRLRGKGFDVKYIDNDKIYINWNKLVESVVNDSYPAIKYSADGIRIDVADTTVPKPSNIKDERFNKMEQEGCGGECCKAKKQDLKKNRPIIKKQRLELARQQQQSKIRHMLKYNN